MFSILNSTPRSTTSYPGIRCSCSCGAAYSISDNFGHIEYPQFLGSSVGVSEIQVKSLGIAECGDGSFRCGVGHVCHCVRWYYSPFVCACAKSGMCLALPLSVCRSQLLWWLVTAAFVVLSSSFYLHWITCYNKHTRTTNTYLAWRRMANRKLWVFQFYAFSPKNPHEPNADAEREYEKFHWNCALDAKFGFYCLHLDIILLRAHEQLRLRLAVRYGRYSVGDVRQNGKTHMKYHQVWVCVCGSTLHDMTRQLYANAELSSIWFIKCFTIV